MKKFFKGLLWGILIFLYISIPVVSIIFIWYNYKNTQTRDIPLLVYYTSQVVGAFATFSAVIVALFGKEIRNKLFGEKCDIVLVDDGLIENLGQSKDTDSPSAQSYDCDVCIINRGSSEMMDCRLLIKEVAYRADKNGKFKSIQTFSNKALYWTNPDVRQGNIMVGDSRKFPLVKIYPANSCQTPDDSVSTPLRLRICGCKLNDKYTQKGEWEITYQFRTKASILSDFVIHFLWDGEWHNRLTEMNDSANVSLKIK